MAQLTINKTGTQVVMELTTTEAPTGILVVPCMQDITINTSVGTYNFTAMCSPDVRKLTTPGDNTIETNIFIDDVAHIGDPLAAANSAARLGLWGLQQNKARVNFKIWLTGKTEGATDMVAEGSGFIGAMSAKVSMDAPIWQTPISIQVDGAITMSRTG